MSDWTPAGADERFLVQATPLAGLLRVRRRPRTDGRGSIERLFCPTLFDAYCPGRAVRQLNRSTTRKAGTLRGLHFQHPPYAEVKFVQCLRGAVYDVAVDLRRGSPTFLQWHGERLSADNAVGLLIPEGFAHGMQTLEDDTELLYVHSADYVPAAEDGFDAFDPRLAITWPRRMADRSQRDATHPPIPHDYEGLPL